MLVLGAFPHRASAPPLHFGVTVTPRFSSNRDLLRAVRDNYKSEHRSAAQQYSALALLFATSSGVATQSHGIPPQLIARPSRAAASFSQLLTTDYGLGTKTHFGVTVTPRLSPNRDLLRGVTDNFKSENHANVSEVRARLRPAPQPLHATRKTKHASPSINHQQSTINSFAADH